MTTRSKKITNELKEEEEFEERLFPIDPQVSLQFLHEQKVCQCGGECKKDKAKGKECSHHSHKKTH